MATIGVLCAEEGDRKRLAILAGEAGHLVCEALRLEDALEILRERRPKVMLIAEGAGLDPEVTVREIARIAPLLPVVVALKVRDATRAVALMRAGASEVVAPPWTPESLRSTISKSLRYQGAALSVAALAPRKPTAHFYFFCVLSFFALAFGFIVVDHDARQQAAVLAHRRTFDLPYQHPSGMLFDRGQFWIVDWFSSSLYFHDSKGLAVERVMAFSTESPVAMAVGPDAIWKVSPEGHVVRHLKDDEFTPVQEYRSAAPNTSAMAYDGLYLWTIDGRNRELRKHLTDDKLSVVGRYPYPGSNPVGLAFDGQSLWSVDAGDRELRRHNLERPDEILRRVDLPEYHDGLYRATGLAWDGKAFWTIAERASGEKGPGKIFRHSMEGL